MRADEAEEHEAHSLVEVVTSANSGVSHNLNGQKLGRKGRVTRDRILAATIELLESPSGEPITMSAVARKASLGMTSLYNYFNDFSELLLAVLDPVMEEAEQAYISMLRSRWSDEELGERCYAFIRAYHDFWARHARLLHLRNLMADNRDQPLLIHRVRATMPIIRLIVAQMDDDAELTKPPTLGMATVLMTGIERTVTTSTDQRLTQLFGPDRGFPPDHYLQPEARLMELAIRDARKRMAGG